MHAVHVYPHNDLFNLADYHLEVINRKASTGCLDAVGLDCMSCLVALAFAVEAMINFVGSKKISSWKERRPFQDKLTEVAKELGFSVDSRIDPYKTLMELKKIRDDMAHGKPSECTVAVTSSSALRRAMAAPWDDFLTPAYANHAFAQANALRDQLLTLSGIPTGDTVTSSVGSWDSRSP